MKRNNFRTFQSNNFCFNSTKNIQKKTLCCCRQEVTDNGEGWPEVAKSGCPGHSWQHQPKMANFSHVWPMASSSSCHQQGLAGDQFKLSSAMFDKEDHVTSYTTLIYPNIQQCEFQSGQTHSHEAPGFMDRLQM